MSDSPATALPAFYICLCGRTTCTGVNAGIINVTITAWYAPSNGAFPTSLTTSTATSQVRFSGNTLLGS